MIYKGIFDGTRLHPGRSFSGGAAFPNRRKESDIAEESIYWNSHYSGSAILTIEKQARRGKARMGTSTM